ncbi:MerR family DNA-binding transcriptional regulator [Nocardia sp. NPDC059239]|uniref:helix-turn-helix domain-containing protein n=1 Tax=unclassified Nocardia TaxID=2637762 RepID=UPI0036945101
MHEDTDLFTVGQLAQRTGLPGRTIRFWSDIGAVPPVARSRGGYRLSMPLRSSASSWFTP